MTFQAAYSEAVRTTDNVRRRPLALTIPAPPITRHVSRTRWRCTSTRLCTLIASVSNDHRFNKASRDSADNHHRHRSSPPERSLRLPELLSGGHVGLPASLHALASSALCFSSHVTAANNWTLPPVIDSADLPVTCRQPADGSRWPACSGTIPAVAVDGPALVRPCARGCTWPASFLMPPCPWQPLMIRSLP